MKSAPRPLAGEGPGGRVSSTIFVPPLRIDSICAADGPRQPTALEEVAPAYLGGGDKE